MYIHASSFIVASILHILTNQCQNASSDSVQRKGFTIFHLFKLQKIPLLFVVGPGQCRSPFLLSPLQDSMSLAS